MNAENADSLCTGAQKRVSRCWGAMAPQSAFSALVRVPSLTKRLYCSCTASMKAMMFWGGVSAVMPWLGERI